MDFFTIIIVIGILFSIVGGIIWYIFIFLVGKAIVTSIARSMGEFQAMDIDGMYRTLLHLQQTGQLQTGQQYMGSLDGPVTSEIRGMAAREGISLDF